MKLYWHPMSGHAHRAQLFLSLIGAKFDLVEVDLAGGAHKAPDFLKLNSFGQVPVLDDDGVIVSDSNAILIYAAKKFGKTDWLPEDARGAAGVQRWLSVAAGQITAFGPAAARACCHDFQGALCRRRSNPARPCDPGFDRVRIGRQKLDRRWRTSDHRRRRAL